MFVEGREERDRGITVVHACTQGCRGLVEYMHIQDLLCRWRRYEYTGWRESVLRGGPRRRYWGIVGDGLPDIRPVTPSSVHHHYPTAITTTTTTFSLSLALSSSPIPDSCLGNRSSWSVNRIVAIYLIGRSPLYPSFRLRRYFHCSEWYHVIQ